MKVVGLTGGIGAGKSTVAAVWKQRGATVLSADRYGHRVLQEDPSARRRLQRHFGSDVIGDDGAVDKRRLAGRAFRSPRATATLNRIIGVPLVRMLRADVARLRRHPSGVLVVDAALLCEWNSALPLNLRVLVSAPLSRRLKWLSRRGLTYREARRRMRAQWSDSRKRAWSDLEIRNDGTLRQLRRKADAAWWHIAENR